MELSREYGREEVERQLRLDFSFQFDIDQDKIELDMRLEDLPDYGILDRQLIAMGLVEMYGTALSDEDFYSLRTVGDVLDHVMRQRPRAGRLPRIRRAAGEAARALVSKIAPNGRRLRSSLHSSCPK